MPSHCRFARPVPLLVAAMLLAACGEAYHGSSDARQAAVEIRLPPAGLEVGDPSAHVVLLEIGDYACPYCRRFHEEVLPGLQTRHVRSGRVRYRYVDVGMDEQASTHAGVVQCLAGVLGVLDAKQWGFDTLDSGGYPDIMEAAALLGWSTDAMSRCVDSTSADRAAEKEAALQLGIRGTPSFIVGVASADGHIVGWPIVGLRTSEITSTLETVARDFASPRWRGWIARARELERDR